MVDDNGETTEMTTLMNGYSGAVELFTRQQCKCETECGFGQVPEGA
jgi:hypothetical protein